MSNTRRKHTKEFKAKVVLEALKERETLEHLAKKFELAPTQISLWKAEAIANYPSAHLDVVRLGIGMYGYSSNAQVQASLQPAVAWKSVVSQVKTIPSGESVGYGCTFVAQKTMKIAVIPIGYADGFRRTLGNGVGAMVIHGVFCPVVGNVCMDMTMIDVSNVEVLEGDAVEIIGEHQSLSAYAKKMNTIPYEVLTSVSSRVHRVYVES